MHAFEPCPDCARHVRVDERACPFCGVAVTLRARPVRRPPRRLGRAAMFAVRTAILGAAGATGACGSATGLEDPIHRSDAAAADAGRRPDAGPVVSDAGAEDAGGAIAMYGTPPPPMDGGPSDAGGEIALYGGPAPVEDAGADAGFDAGPPVVPAYGGPTPVPG